MAIKYLDAKRLQGTNAERLALSTLGSTGWTTQTEGTLSVAIDATNNEIDFSTGFSTSQLGAGSYDLQSTGGLNGNNADNETWVLRFKIVPTTQAEDYNLTMMISSTQNALTTTSADRIGFLLYGGGTNWLVNDFGGWSTGGAQFWTDSSAWGASLYGNDSSLTRDTDPLYVTIQRTSGTVASMSITKNSDYTTSAYTITTSSTVLPSSVQDLRYITFQSASHATNSNRLVGTISDVKFWNSTIDTDDPVTITFDFTNTYPDLPNGTIFNETDAYKYFMWNGTDTWNQMVSS